MEENEPIITELTDYFDCHLLSTGKKELTLKTANQLINGEEKFQNIDLKKTLEKGKLPHAYQTEISPKQWYIKFSRPNEYRELRKEYLKEHRQIEVALPISTKKPIEIEQQYKIWGIVIIVLVICALFKLSTPSNEQKVGSNREEKIKKQFSAWDGSHINLSTYIKETMNDPDSYVHVKTKYVDNDDFLFVMTEYRGKNAFGGIVTEYIHAKVDLDGNILEIVP